MSKESQYGFAFAITITLGLIVGILFNIVSLLKEIAH